MIRILVAGEINADLVLQNPSSFPAPGQEVLVEDASLTLGSASAICAAGLAKLGNTVSFIGKTGADMWSAICLEWLKDLGIDTSCVISDPQTKTGLTVSITSKQDRALVTHLGAIETLQASDISDSLLRAHTHLHVSSFYLQRALRPELPALLARARRAGLTTSLDPGFDPSEKWGADLLQTLDETDVFLPNEVELAGTTGVAAPADALQALIRRRAFTVAKLGREGSMAIVDGELVHVPAYRVDAVDTTGAGDSFNAGFLHAWLRGQPVKEAMRFAAACGAISTLRLGGTSHQATEKNALEFLAQQESVAV